MTSPALDIVPMWARLNEGVIRLVDYVPDDKLNWSPQDNLWNFKGILIHISGARHGWLQNSVQDGEPSPDALRAGQTKDGIKEQLRLSWDRLSRFLADPKNLAAEYRDEEGPVTGNWIAYHLLEHDIHHRADIFHYLALLGVEHPEVGTP